jgi:2,3-bisphosphoglycerate-dependent phosphoglycerate mutase
MPPSPTRLIIARHGNTFAEGDVVTRLGVTDLPLVASGEEQGRRLGDYLRREHLIPDIAYTSTLQRTIRMAELVQEVTGAAFPTHALTFLNEVDYGEDENMPEERVVARVGAEALRLWDEQGIPPQGWKVDVAAIIEGWRTFAAGLVQEDAARGRTVLVVTSNGIARFAPTLTGDMEAFRAGGNTLKLSTGALSMFEYRGDGRWDCTAWGVKP